MTSIQEPAGGAYPPAPPAPDPAHAFAPNGDGAGSGQAGPPPAARNAGAPSLQSPVQEASRPQSSPLTPLREGCGDGGAREEAPGVLRPAGASPAESPPGEARPLAASPGGSKAAPVTFAASVHCTVCGTVPCADAEEADKRAAKHVKVTGHATTVEVRATVT